MDIEMSSVFLCEIYSKLSLWELTASCRGKSCTVHWGAPNSLLTSYFQPCTNSTWGIKGNLWLPFYRTADAKKGTILPPDLFIALRRYAHKYRINIRLDKAIRVTTLTIVLPVSKSTENLMATCPVKYGMKLVINPKLQRLYRWSLGYDR